MGRDATGRRQGSVSGHDGDSPASLITVKVTLHLTVGTAQRLGVESAMRRIGRTTCFAAESEFARLSLENGPFQRVATRRSS